MAVCIYCGTEYSLERQQCGYEWCMDRACVAKGLYGPKSNYRLINMPKQGYAYVEVGSDDLKNNNKSSGR